IDDGIGVAVGFGRRIGTPFVKDGVSARIGYRLDPPAESRVHSGARGNSTIIIDDVVEEDRSVFSPNRPRPSDVARTEQADVLIKFDAEVVIFQLHSMGSTRRAAGARSGDLAAGHELFAVEEENVAGVIAWCPFAGASALDDAETGEIPADPDNPVAVGG